MTWWQGLLWLLCIYPRYTFYRLIPPYTLGIPLYIFEQILTLYIIFTQHLASQIFLYDSKTILRYCAKKTLKACLFLFTIHFLFVKHLKIKNHIFNFLIPKFLQPNESLDYLIQENS